jgi:glycosyltransferase involved in cell wall biosynthesis
VTTTAPVISIVVPTRNRPEDALSCARRILAGVGLLELVVVDQSDGPETATALAAIRDPRLRCIRSNLRGATNARNTGIAATTGDVIAFTDDDCRVAPDWTERLSEIFQSDPAAAVVCGRVVVPAEVQQRGFAMAFEPQVREWHGRFPPPDRDWGITANLAIRRDVLSRVGPFDPVLGPGAPLQCGEEPDLLFRVLRTGLKVVNAREVIVDHFGARSFGAESRQLWRTYGVGTSAALFKHVRLGDWRAAGLYMSHIAILSRVVVRNLLTGKRPTGIDYTLAFLSGAVKSFRFDIDRHRKLYEPTGARG